MSLEEAEADLAVRSTILEMKAKRQAKEHPDPLKELRDLPNNKVGVFGSSADTPAFRDVAHTEEREEEPLLVQLKSFVPIRGKTAFTVWHMLSAPLSALKAKVIQQEGFPRRPITLHVDSSDPLDETKSLLDLGYRFPPLLSIQGFDFEYTVHAVGVDMTLTLPWRVHLTSTDLVRDVFRRYQPCDLRLTRFSIQDTTTGERKILDTSRCYQYPKDSSVEPTSTMIDLKLAYHNEDPVTVRFIRTKEGVPLKFELHKALNCGATTVQELTTTILNLEATGELDQCLVDMTEDNVELVNSACPFDDEDEEISPGGEKRIYFLGCDLHATFSFNPPEEDSNFVTPHFVPIDEDFSIPHLADQGVWPGTRVLLEYFNPQTQTWSGDTEESLKQELMENGKHSNNTVELLTVKTQRGALLRIPVTALTKMDTIQHRVWCVTGDLPMFTVLQTDAGRLLMIHETLVGAQLFPQSTIHSLHRPRAWLGESPLLPPPKHTALLSISEPDVLTGAAPK